MNLHNLPKDILIKLIAKIQKNIHDEYDIYYVYADDNYEILENTGQLHEYLLRLLFCLFNKYILVYSIYYILFYYIIFYYILHSTIFYYILLYSIIFYYILLYSTIFYYI